MIKEFLNKVRFSKGHGGVLARGATGVFVVKFAGVGVLFALHIMLAQILGAKYYGMYAYTWAWVNILVVLCTLGFQTSLVRFIAEYKAKNQWGLLRGVLTRSRQVVIASSFIVSITGAVVIYFLGNNFSGGLKITFYLALSILPFFALVRLQGSSLRALKHVVRAEVLLRVIRPVLMAIAVIILFFWLGKSLKASHAMVANLTAFIVIVWIGAVLLNRSLPEDVHKSQFVFASKEWLQVSLPLLLVAAMHIILKRTDIVMLGILKGPQQAGIYFAATKVSYLVVFSLTAVNTILAPMISELYHTGKKRQLQKIITLATRAIFIFTLFMSLVLVVFGKFILGLFGTAFIIAYIPLLILLAGQIVNSFAGSVGNIMSMSGRQNVMGFIVGISAAINILLNIILIPLLGLTGAAISTAVTMMLWNIVMLVYVYKELGINSTVVSEI